MTTPHRGSTVADIERIAGSLPEAVRGGSDELPSWAVHGKTFIFFREPRPDAVDGSGDRLTDVICIRTHGADDKQALLDDDQNPFFTTPHFNGYPAVLVRTSDLRRLDPALLEEVIVEAWLSRAPKRVAKAYLAQFE
ncbi:MmcQ/YjbR family DNA-binding protein [Aestuariimicrobium sp. T2.26MG-19.2B]|uniref:MmcQ/YjbR family DNA-binding protein n=1 Tax=Aestuariimicrobium sp. T2.26MG-19.2B TaxID=3040679 RepID=UPI0025403DCC|nr:MmcQ/YjbR family DNA-binding protein [Aestuariimicrobium sp. T2.26MG-19.2B]